jgi:hypothetical protein
MAGSPGVVWCPLTVTSVTSDTERENADAGPSSVPLHSATRLTVTRTARTLRYQVACASFTSLSTAWVTFMHGAIAMFKIEAWREKNRRHDNRESAMFDQPPSLAMRAALASLLGSLFGIGLIVFSNSANAQATDMPPAPAAVTSPSTTPDAVAVIRRLGDATLRSLRGAEPAIRGLRIHDSSVDVSSGLRWTTAPRRVLRSEVENPRGNDLISLGVQLSF